MPEPNPSLFYKILRQKDKQIYRVVATVIYHLN